MQIFFLSASFFFSSLRAAASGQMFDGLPGITGGAGRWRFSLQEGNSRRGGIRRQSWQEKSRSAARLPGWRGLIEELLAVDLLYDLFEHVRRQSLGKVLADPLADIVAGAVQKLIDLFFACLAETSGGGE